MVLTVVSCRVDVFSQDLRGVLNETDFLQNEPNLILFYFTKAWLETLKGPVN